MYTAYSLVYAISAGLFAWVGCGVYLRLLATHTLDYPDARSNHELPVPTGAGVAIITAMLLFFFATGAPTPLLFSIILLMVVGYVDDRKHIPARYRFGVQLIAVCFSMTALTGSVLQGTMPSLVEFALVALAWIWLINLTNFMDGIDTMSIVETVSLCLGVLAVVAAAPETPVFLINDAMIIGGAMIGFFPFNCHKARLFMGDSGSTPLGLLFGYMLFNLAASGQWAAALILPAYYLTDTGWTLLCRAMAGKRLWEAHSEHAYQRAVRIGAGHDEIAGRVALLNAILILVAVSAACGWVAPLLGLAAAFGLAFLFTLALGWRGRPDRYAAA